MGEFGSDMNFDFEVGQMAAVLHTMSPIHRTASYCAFQKTPQTTKRKDTNKGWHTDLV